VTSPIDLRDAVVLVTGGTGFLGRRIVSKLEAGGARPVPLASGDYDLTQPDRVRAALAEISPRYVIHAAAVVGGIGANRAQPARFFYDNAVMGVHLIHEAWRAGIEKLVIIGTVCSYPKFAPVPFSERDLWNGYPEETNAPYGIAKKMLIVQSQAYRDQYGFNSVCLLPTNLYGPEDSSDLKTSHVIPAIIRKCLDAKAEGRQSVVLWGTGNPTREFLYVDDAAVGIVAALERYDGAEPLNLGSQGEISIRELAHLIAEVTGFQGDFEWDDSEPDGQPRRAVDWSSASELLQWRPEVELREGLRRTVESFVAGRR
jgi:nucleoside-diphosphate-sugar epimerase